jgi:transcriptional regulator with XRE-family HTH domain
MDWVDRLRQAVSAKGKHSAVAAEAGVDPSALSDILRRETDDPKLQTIIRVCRVCGVTVGWVLGESGFELGEADYDFLGRLSDWIQSKRELRNQQPATAAPPLVVKELPAVATKRGVTWGDEDEIRDREIPIDYQRSGANAVFRTRGDSMIDAGIFDGDVLFVRRTTNYRTSNGHVIVGRLDGTFTVKRLRFDNGIITLFSGNQSDPEPITIDQEAERFTLTGIVVGLQRDFVRR